MVLVKAKIKNEKTEWEEDFTVQSLETAVAEICTIVDSFNVGASEKREFVTIIGFVKIDSLKEYSGFARQFLMKVGREARNAYGSQWCKNNYARIEKVINDLHNRNGLQKFKQYVQESPFSVEFQHLIEWENNDNKT